MLQEKLWSLFRKVKRRDEIDFISLIKFLSEKLIPELFFLEQYMRPIYK